MSSELVRLFSASFAFRSVVSVVGGCVGGLGAGFRFRCGGFGRSVDGSCLGGGRMGFWTTPGGVTDRESSL